MAKLAQKKAPKKHLHIKHCIKKMQCRAKWVGTLYVIAMVALFGLACLQPIFGDGAGVFAFWKPFTLFTTEGDFISVLVNNALSIATAVLYAVMLLVLLINLVGALCSMGWLFKKKASKLYGFNRNMYAMDDIEKAYNSTFKTIVVINVLIAVLSFDITFGLLLVGATLGVGLFFHFLCGTLAGNTSLFTVDGEIIEEKRNVGTFSAFVRNFLQVLATAGIVYFFVKSSGEIASFLLALTNGGMSTYTSEPLSLVLPAARLAILILSILMICYALGTTEFEPSGRETAGRKTFKRLSFITFLVSFGATVFLSIYYKIPLDGALMSIAGISLVAFVLEICLRKFPKSKEKNPDEVDANKYLDGSVKDEEQEVALQPQILPPVYVPMTSYEQNYQD